MTVLGVDALSNVGGWGIFVSHFSIGTQTDKPQLFSHCISFFVLNSIDLATKYELTIPDGNGSGYEGENSGKRNPICGLP